MVQKDAVIQGVYKRWHSHFTVYNHRMSNHYKVSQTTQNLLRKELIAALKTEYSELLHQEVHNLRNQLPSNLQITTKSLKQRKIY